MSISITQSFIYFKTREIEVKVKHTHLNNFKGVD
jgi:hypothetical protein